MGLRVGSSRAPTRARERGRVIDERLGIVAGPIDAPIGRSSAAGRLSNSTWLARSTRDDAQLAERHTVVPTGRGCGRRARCGAWSSGRLPPAVRLRRQALGLGFEAIHSDWAAESGQDLVCGWVQVASVKLIASTVHAPSGLMIMRTCFVRILILLFNKRKRRPRLPIATDEDLDLAVVEHAALDRAAEGALAAGQRRGRRIPA